MRRNQNSTGMLALVGLGLYYAYRNRFKIQQFFQSKGINTPIDTSTLGDTIQSGVAKLKGSAQYGADQLQQDLNQRKVG